MFFPAGIPILAVVALIVWNSRHEAERQRGSASSKKPS
jgi:hypothetical protein